MVKYSTLLYQKAQSMQQQQELPYVPLVFVKSGVIGGKKSQQSDLHNQYDYNYRDFLKPHLLENHNSVIYILFHSPSIYNWLRTIPSKESQLLNKYITTDRAEKSFNSINNIPQIISSLEDYVSRWQVVKLAFCSTVYVSKVRQSGSQACPHLAKTQQNVIELCFDAKSKTMNSNKVKCKECRRVVEIQGHLKNVGNQLISRNVQFSLQIKDKKYQALIFFSNNAIYVKSAYKTWFEINIQTAKTKVIGINAINLKQIQLAVYKGCWDLKDHVQEAKPIQLYKNNVQFKQKLRKNNQQPMLQQQQVDQRLAKLQKDQKKISLKSSNIDFKSQNNGEKIKQLKFIPNKVVLRQQQYDKQYVQQVQKQYIMPKVKDEYQLDYDKGKLKKIKQKKNYIQPDYNQVYTMLRKQEKMGKFQQSKKIRKERRNEIKGNYRKDSDQQYD